MKINLSLPILAGALVSAILPITSFAQTRSRCRDYQRES